MLLVCRFGTIDVCAQMNYQNKEMLVGAMIVAGYDDELGGQIYGVPIGGSMVQQKWATDGSGSTYIWGYMDSSFRCVATGNTLAVVGHPLVCVVQGQLYARGG